MRYPAQRPALTAPFWTIIRRLRPSSRISASPRSGMSRKRSEEDTDSVAKCLNRLNEELLERRQNSGRSLVSDADQGKVRPLGVHREPQYRACRHRQVGGLDWPARPRRGRDPQDRRSNPTNDSDFDAKLGQRRALEDAKLPDQVGAEPPHFSILYAGSHLYAEFWPALPGPKFARCLRCTLSRNRFYRAWRFWRFLTYRAPMMW